jgi:hypothetical protein
MLEKLFDNLCDFSSTCEYIEFIKFVFDFLKNSLHICSLFPFGYATSAPVPSSEVEMLGTSHGKPVPLLRK